MTCRAPHCSTGVPDDKPFCPSHWHILSAKLKARYHHAKTPEEREAAIEACATFVEMAEFGARLLL